jgi:hypothetical protein
MEITVNYFDKEENEKEIEVKVNISAYFDGIGPYEYWGHKGYDKGNLCIDINEIIYDKAALTEDEISQIQEEIASQDFQEKILEKHLDQNQALADDAAEAAYESLMESQY